MPKVNTDPGFSNDSGVNILWWEYNPAVTNWCYNNSCGNFWQLYYNLTAGAVIHYNGMTYTPDASQVLVIPPLVNFDSENDRPFSHLAIHFTMPVFMHETEKKIYQFQRTPSEVLPFQHFDRLIDILSGGGVRDELKFMRLYQLLFDLAAFFARNNCKTASPESGDERIRLAAQYICANPGLPLSNQELAKKFGMSERSFLRQFHKEFNMPPCRYSRVMRIESARLMMLRNSSESLDVIAESCGFSDRFHFSKVFKAVTRCTPAEYRRFQNPICDVSGAHLYS